jgi:hypothetical protein
MAFVGEFNTKTPNLVSRDLVRKGIQLIGSPDELKVWE